MFGSDLEDSDEEQKATKPPKKSEQDAQMNELFGDSPSEEEEVEGGGEHDSESDKEEAESDEGREERKNSFQEGEDGDNEKDNEVRNEAAAFWCIFFVTLWND